jgi:hypothetical protein
MMRRIITIFKNPFCCVVHDTAKGGAFHPDWGHPIEGLAEFFRELHHQRATHRETGVPYSISQKILLDPQIEQGNPDENQRRQP